MKESKNEVEPFNPMPDGTCRTVKSQYYKNGYANLSRGDGYGATAVKVTNMADQNAIELPSELKGKKFRIRKLTPRECFRLMGVDDKDIDKIQAAGVSNSAQYKLAGNSIVVDVLFHIFRKMFIETDNEGQQLTLF